MTPSVSDVPLKEGPFRFLMMSSAKSVAENIRIDVVTNAGAIAVSFLRHGT
jgi:hypothetical protein